MLYIPPLIDYCVVYSVLPEPVSLSPRSTCCFKQKNGTLCNKEVFNNERYSQYRNFFIV